VEGSEASVAAMEESGSSETGQGDPQSTHVMAFMQNHGASGLGDDTSRLYVQRDPLNETGASPIRPQTPSLAQPVPHNSRVGGLVDGTGAELVTLA